MHVISTDRHRELVIAAYASRGFEPDECEAAARLCESASRHGIRTHNIIKALHLDDLFGTKVGGCVAGAKIEVLPTRFKAVQHWDAHLKLGQAVAYEAVETCIRLADEYGSGTVAIDNACHYLWGGGYALEAAQRGYVAYTNCTAARSEVVPLGGSHPTLGTNPHTWGFPTTKQVGFPILVDWATSTVAMGRVQQFQRENKPLPPGAAVDADGNPTTDPHQAKWLLPFGAHKGYGLCLLNELWGALIGGSLPTLRGMPDNLPEGEKASSVFYFHVVHPDAIAANTFAAGRTRDENLAAVLHDVLGHGNENCMLPGQPEANAARESDAQGGLLFSDAELAELNTLAESLGLSPLA